MPFKCTSPCGFLLFVAENRKILQGDVEPQLTLADNFLDYCLLGVSYYAVLLSELVSVTIKSEPSTNSADFDPMFPIPETTPETEFQFRVFYRNVA